MRIRLTRNLANRLKRFAPLAVLGIFTLTVIAVYHLFADIDPKELRAALSAVTPGQIGIALVLTLTNYCVLFGYDFTALAYLKKKIPPAVVSLTSFTAYGIGNMVGLSMLSGGAVRFRMYGRYGMDSGDIALLTVFCAMSFGLGNAVLAFGANALVASPLGISDPQYALVIRVASVIFLVSILAAAFIASARRATFQIAGFRVVVPPPAALAFQIALAVLDISLAAGVLYFLFPEASRPDYLPLFFWFAIAVGAGVLSHIPGGAGVFEAVIAVGLAGQVNLPELASTLLLYRLVYYIVPFLLALTAFLFSGPLTRLLDRAPVPQAENKYTVSPLTTAAAFSLSRMTLFGGGLLLISAIIPLHFFNGGDIATHLPLVLVEAGSLVAAVAGMCLVVLSMALARRVRAAWVITIILLLAGIAVAFLVLHAVLVGAVLVFNLLLAIAGQAAFHRASQIGRWFLSPYFAASVCAIAIIACFTLFFFHKDTAYSNTLWLTFAHDAHAARALRAAGAGMSVLFVGALFQVLRPPLRHTATGVSQDSGKVLATIAEGTNANGGLALSGDKKLLWSDDANAFLMFQEHGRSLIALDDPVGGSVGGESDLIDTFMSYAEKTGRRPFFYEIGAASLPYILDAGLQPFKIGEEAVVDLESFSLGGKQGRSLRTAHNKAERDGLEFEMLAPPFEPAFIEELRAISDDWLSAKHGREKGFSVGSFSPSYISCFPVAVVKFDGKVVAFANVMQAGKETATIDLMRHSEQAPGGTMDFLFTELILALKANAVKTFSLGLAPLSGLENKRRMRMWDQVGLLIYKHGNRFYGFRGLRAFKDKFHPAWVPRYVAALSITDLAAGLADVAALINRPLVAEASNDAQQASVEQDT